MVLFPPVSCSLFFGIKHAARSDAVGPGMTSHSSELFSLSGRVDLDTSLTGDHQQTGHHQYRYGKQLIGFDVSVEFDRRFDLRLLLS